MKAFKSQKHSCYSLLFCHLHKHP